MVDFPLHTISLADLQPNMIPGITAAWGALFKEAIVECFANQGHVSGVSLAVIGDFPSECLVVWDGSSNDQSQRAWADHQEMTEFGACGLAILLVVRLTQYKVVERSRKGTGFDYWLANNNDVEPFKNSARLEVSGILKGDVSQVSARVGLKLKQITRSDHLSLPGVVIVTEFGAPLSEVKVK